MDFVDAVDMFGGDDDTQVARPTSPVSDVAPVTPPTKEEPRWPRSFVQHHDTNLPPRVFVPTRVTLGAVRVAEVPPRSTRALDPPTRGAMGVLTARLPLRSLRLGVNAWREWREEVSSQ